MKKKQYTNIFLKIGFSQEEIIQKITDVWQDLFESTNKIYFPVEDDMGYMLDTGNNDARSEGMSYGLMMAVQMDRQDIFDRLWKWSKTYMFMKTGIHAGYFAWSCRTDGTKNAYGPAPDGEEYFALALFFAAHRWGSREEPFNYETQAQEILRTCLHNHEREKSWTEHDHPLSKSRKTGYSMWNIENYLIKFVPETDFTDPSYHLPHFYELFAKWAYPEDRKFWDNAAKCSRDFLPKTCHPKTGFAPEYAYYDGRPHPHFNGAHMDFYSDSYRVAANIGLDSEWFGKRSWQKKIIDKIHLFFTDINLEDYQAYTIDGKAVKKDYVHNVGLLSTNAMAALTTETEVSKNMVHTFWNTPLRTDNRRYYDNCLYFFTVLALSGNYRIY